MSTGTVPTTPMATSVPVPKYPHKKEHKLLLCFKFMFKNKNIKLSGGGLKSYNLFDKIISSKNLFVAWADFKEGKRWKPDVLQFEKSLRHNIFTLCNDLKYKKYKHSEYFSFYIKDPKLRHIHKACVRDRVLHHAVFRILYSIFDKAFIFDSYSCRLGKGTHRAVNRLNEFAKKVGKNNTKNCHILKCDVRKFFDSISHNVLINLIKKKIRDEDTVWLINEIIESYFVAENKGIPLGNITSQLFANIYLNELDKFVKHKLKVRYYIRYCDDFVILSDNTEYLQNLISRTGSFIENNLKLSLHPHKSIIRKYGEGVDFLGYISFPNFIILRLRTQKECSEISKEK